MSDPAKSGWGVPKGWCPSVLRPMELADGLMVRIRPVLSRLSQDQALGLADLAERFGAGVIELTNRSNLQLRGLSDVEHAALVPELDALALTDIDRTESGRVNIALSPFADGEAETLYWTLYEALAEARWAALPQKFGFLIDTGPVRVMQGIVADIRLERALDGLCVRAEGQAQGRVSRDVPQATAQALDLAAWFLSSGAIGPDGRGRMAEARPPDALIGESRPVPAKAPDLSGPAWPLAREGRLSPAALRQAAAQGEVRISPFRALYLPNLAADLASPLQPWNKTGQRADVAPK